MPTPEQFERIAEREQHLKLARDYQAKAQQYQREHDATTSAVMRKQYFGYVRQYSKWASDERKKADALK